MQNLERFVALRDSESIRIRDIEANFVIQKNNYHEISQFVQFAHSLKIKSGFSLITCFHELHDCIDQVKDSIEEAVAVAASCGEHETEQNLTFLLSELPGYKKKIKKLHFMYTILGHLHNDKLLFLIRRHNKVRSFIKKVLRLS